MMDVISSYGVAINRSGFCSCPFHHGDNTPSLKVYKDNFHCYACGTGGDIFTWVMKMNNVSFKEAYILLGGQEKVSFATQRRIDKARDKRLRAKRAKEREEKRIKEVIKNIDFYREKLEVCQPLTWGYVHFYNKLQYQLYLLEVAIEHGELGSELKRINE